MSACCIVFAYLWPVYASEWSTNLDLTNVWSVVRFGEWSNASCCIRDLHEDYCWQTPYVDSCGTLRLQMEVCDRPLIPDSQ